MPLMSEERDWSELPSELIHLIAKQLPDLLDFIRFRAVCKTWRSSAPLSDPPHQFPWLLEIFKRKYCSGLRKRQRYYSASSGKTFMIPFKNRKPRLKTWIQPAICSRYLTFNGDHTFSFLNPLTKDQFSFSHNCRIKTLDWDHLLYNDTGEWSSLDTQNNKWVEHKGFIYRKNILEQKYFPTRESSPTDVFDADSKELLHVIPSLRQTYLIESSKGIFRVSWFHDWHMKSTVESSVFRIYWLDSDSADGKPCWVQLADIGDQIFFLDGMNGFSMTTRPSTRFREGCIYFIDLLEDKPYVHDVLAGTVERVPCPFKRCTWFLPGL